MARRADTAAALERWVKYYGVPQFSDDHSVRDRLGLLLFLLLSVVAFELGAAPWYEPNAPQFLLALVGVMCLTLCIRPAVRALLEPDRPKSPWWSIVMRVVVLGVALYALERSSLLREHPEVTVNFPVLLLTAACAAALSSRSWWGAVLLARRRRGIALLAVLGLAVVVFALEGSVFAPANELADYRMQQAVPALVVMGCVFLAVLLLSRGLDRTEEQHDVPERELAFVFPAASLLTLWLGLETALLPHIPFGRAQLPLSMAIVAVLLLLALIRPRGDIRSGPGGRARLLPWFAVLFIVAYPAIVGLYLEIDVGADEPVEGGDAFWLVAAFHAVCLLIATGVVRLGLDRVAAWAPREARANLGSVVKGIGRGLPLLLILTVFLLMQAELWQVAFLTRSVPFLALVATMAVVGFGVMLASSRHELDRQSAFKDWDAVREAARHGDESDAARAPEEPPIDAKLARLERQRVSVPPFALCGLRRLNAVLVIAVYQAIIFVPLALIAALVFWGLARLAVPEGVAAEWIYGDNATDAQIADVTAPGPLAEPWARVALLLAAFCFLNLTVQIPSSKDQRQNFLGGADRVIKQRLAALVVYRAPLCPCGTPTSEALAGDENGWECRTEACPKFGQVVNGGEREERFAERREADRRQRESRRAVI